MSFTWEINDPYFALFDEIFSVIMRFYGLE